MLACQSIPLPLQSLRDLPVAYTFLLQTERFNLSLLIIFTIFIITCVSSPEDQARQATPV